MQVEVDAEVAKEVTEIGRYNIMEGGRVVISISCGGTEKEK